MSAKPAKRKASAQTIEQPVVKELMELAGQFRTLRDDFDSRANSGDMGYYRRPYALLLGRLRYIASNFAQGQCAHSNTYEKRDVDGPGWGTPCTVRILTYCCHCNALLPHNDTWTDHTNWILQWD